LNREIWIARSGKRDRAYPLARPERSGDCTVNAPRVIGPSKETDAGVHRVLGVTRAADGQPEPPVARGDLAPSERAPVGADACWLHARDEYRCGLSRVGPGRRRDRKSTRLNSSHRTISYAVFCLKKKTK